MQLFHRNGTKASDREINAAKPTKRADTFYVDRTGPCGRCGGQGGSDAWKFTGYICYRCGGRNSMDFEHYTDKLYTAERLAKLNEIAQRKADKKAAAARRKAEKARQEFIAWAKPHGKLIGRILIAGPAKYGEPQPGFIGDLASKLRMRRTLSDRQLEAAARVLDQIEERKAQDAASEWIGAVKERLVLDIEVLHIHDHMGYYGPIDIIKMRDSAGNMLTWFASGHHGLRKGDRAEVKGTVKKHDEYKGVKQTVLTRCIVLNDLKTVTPDEAAQMEQIA